MMRLNPGQRNDPIMQDIKRAAESGHFDRLKEQGPSDLMLMTVDELLEKTRLMSGETRRAYLATIGRLRSSSISLSDQSETPARKNVSLSDNQALRPGAKQNGLG